MNIINLSLCVDCVQYDADSSYGWEGDTKPLTKLKGWVISPAYDSEGDLEPHFSRGGTWSCDGCETTLGGNRYDYTGAKP